MFFPFRIIGFDQPAGSQQVRWHDIESGRRNSHPLFTAVDDYPSAAEGIDHDGSSPRQGAPGQQHRHASPVAAVFVAECVDQVAFFKENADEDVGGGHCGEQQNALRSSWELPKTR
jgi:hypothetical protein